ncbi:hypothetical protein COL05_12890 [Bacillus sp. AFS059628]|nr:hypothetical protein COL05_12890 [Bacillus sp. AFS059628]
MKKENITLSGNEIQRLKKLLEYSNEAIEYWFNDCDADPSLLQENNVYKLECKYFLGKLNYR